MSQFRHLIYIAVAAIALGACSGPKLSVADEQLARGEYFDAQKTYRKIYNKLNPREQRTLRGEVAAKMGSATPVSVRTLVPRLPIRMHSVTATVIPPYCWIWRRPSTVRAIMRRP